MWDSYEIAGSVEEALQLLSRYNGQAQIIAGGTDLLVELQERGQRRACLVDVTRIPGLDAITLRGQHIVLGPNVTFRQILESLLLRERAQVLVEAARSVGALPIQTVATIAGNIISAQPAADGSVALLALDAEVRTTSRGGQSWRPLGELFVGPGRSAVDPASEMITSIRFPALGAGDGSAWERIGRREGLVLPMLNCAVCVGLLDSGDRFRRARIALGPVAPVPWRARDAEEYLAGKVAAQETVCQAAELVACAAQPRSSPLRASREYRLKMVTVLVRQGLEKAVARARDGIAPS